MKGASIYDLKAAALLHDPPWKPWILTQRLDCVVSEGTRELGCTHEVEADALIKRVWPWREVLGERPSQHPLIKDADIMAATMDRAALNIIYEGRGERLSSRKLVLVNILRPGKDLMIRERVSRKEVSDYVEKLENIMKRLRDKALAYNVLFAVYEFLWYQSCKSLEHVGTCSPPADTRLPTHTVFDHGRAAASVLNWMVGEGGLRGFLIRLDLASIQHFISMARKVVDLWAGSWLVSLMMWKIIEDVVRYVGPDTVLMPALELNPFYYASLARWLGEAGVDDEIVLDIVGAASVDGRQLASLVGQPLMPGTAVLALPCIESEEELRDAPDDLKEVARACDASKWREYFVKKYVETWKSVVEAVEDKVHGIIDSCPNAREKMRYPDVARRLLNVIKDRPPLPIRVAALDVAKSFNELLSELEKISLEVGERERVAKSLLLYWMLRKGLERLIKEEGLKSVKFLYSTPAADAIAEYTREVYVSGGSFTRCSVCGIEPAVIVVRADNEACMDGIKLLGGAVRDGEQLGPYCLIKRLVGKYASRVAKKLGIGWDTKVRSPIMANVELANLVAEARFACGVAKELGLGGDGNGHDVPPQLYKVMKAVCDESVLDGARRVYSISQCLGEGDVLPIYDAITTGKSGEVEKFVRCLAEELDLSNEQARIVEDLLKSVRKEVRHYYALVKGDGDFFGSRILGGVLGLSPDDYIRTVLSAAEVSSEDVVRYHGKLVRVAKELLGIDEELSTVPTPTYYRAVSRAMMATALKDVELVDDLFGVLIYAGGDDIAAMLPASVDLGGDGRGAEELIPAKAVALTRRNYWGSAKAPCFHALRVGGGGSQAFYPALCAFGRSYGVVIAHFMDPFRQVWDLAGALEEIKDEVELNRGSGWVHEKDVVAVFYGRVGSVGTLEALSGVAITPNVPVTWDEWLRGGARGELTIEVAEYLAGEVMGEKLSRSFLSDTLRTDFRRALAETLRVDPGRAADLIRYAVARNVTNEAVKGEVMGEVLERLRPLLGTVVRVGVTEKQSPLLVEVLLMSKYLYSGRR